MGTESREFCNYVTPKSQHLKPRVLLNSASKRYEIQGQDWFAVTNKTTFFEFNLALVHTFEHCGPVLLVQFSYDSKYLATVCFNSVQVFNVETGGRKVTFIQESGEHEGFVTGCFSPDVQIFAIGGKNGDISIGDIEQKRINRCLRGHTSEISSLVYSRCGNTLVSGSEDGSIRFWRMDRGSEVRKVWIQAADRIASMTLSQLSVTKDAALN